MTETRKDGSSRVLGVPGAMSQDRTRVEARENVVDALRLLHAHHDDVKALANGGSESLEFTLTD